MTNVNISVLEEQFKTQCKVISLKYEYGIDSSLPQWAIISSLTEDEIKSTFPEQASRYAPFIVLTPMMGKALQKYTKNEDKHRKRRLRSIDIYGYDDEISPKFHRELSLSNEFFFENERTKQEQQSDLQLATLREGIDQLSEIQKRRLKAAYFEGKTSREIAKEEGVNYSAVDKSIMQAFKKIRKYFQEMGVQNPTFVQMSEGVVPIRSRNSPQDKKI
ncbi:MAG: sigma factor-like helix-turn-helix DNA-binding protein [Paludibacter sp.]|nr:sigma factor-like helix-turn-helix DNA-binding protein [Paludibacter sp.]